MYENYRDVAITSVDAAAEGHSIFEGDEIMRLAAQADVSPAAALEAMPLLQGILARATAAFCSDMADAIRPRDFGHRGVLARLFPSAVDD